MMHKEKIYSHLATLIKICICVLALWGTGYIVLHDPRPASAHHQCTPPCCTPSCCNTVRGCGVGGCACESTHQTEQRTIPHITKEFIMHREWIIKILWEAHILPAMMLMTEQISTMAMHQMLMIGSFFDAKHQLETQRLLQDMQAQAHKDYHPSEGMCTFGTTTRSLAATDRNMDFTQIALAARGIQRQLLNGDGIGGAGGMRDDAASRFDQFKKVYCNPKDFGNGMDLLCDGSTKERYNKDVHFTHTIDSAKHLEIDFSKDDVTADEEDVLALSANLFGPRVLPYINEEKMANSSGDIIEQGAFAYMKARALAAQRSVAQAAYAAHVAMKTQGEDEVQPFLDAILKDMGIEEDDREVMVGERPSYYGQMEILTKKLYQTPNFYAELYDKPTNVSRKNAAMTAIGLMQMRDMYRSRLRSEAIIAVWLENELGGLESLYVNEAEQLTEDTPILNLEGF